MATVTKSIGTAGGRDYATITAWEADLDNAGIYASGDDAIGECYNDSAFDESVTINGGGTVGLNSITLTVPESERHDGTAGTGARIVASTGRSVNLARNNLVFEWLEIDENGQNPTAIVTWSGDWNQSNVQLRNTLLHDPDGAASSRRGVSLASSRNGDILNNIVYDMVQPAVSSQPCYGIQATAGFTVNVMNNTVYNTTNDNGSGVCYGIYTANNTDTTIKNNISTDTGGTTSGSKNDFNYSGTNPDSTNNLSSDDTSDDAGGSGHLINKSSSAQFVSIVEGSEDLHLKSGTDALDAGVDLGQTPPGVEIDIDGYDRHAGGTLWSMGAHDGNNLRGVVIYLPAVSAAAGVPGSSEIQANRTLILSWS